jgi:hypothetical protein
MFFSVKGVGFLLRGKGSHIIQEVAQAAEGQDKEIDLLHQLALARLVVGREVLAESRCGRHGCSVCGDDVSDSSRATLDSGRLGTAEAVPRMRSRSATRFQLKKNGLAHSVKGRLGSSLQV